MSEQLYSLTPVQLGVATLLLGIGMLAASLLTMSQWLVYRRVLATLFLLSVEVLFAFYMWAFATVFIHSHFGIFLLRDRHFGWFVVVCLCLGLATLTTRYRYTQAPLVVMLIPALPPFIVQGGIWILLTGASLTTSWLLIQVWRDWQLMHRDINAFSVKNAMDQLEQGVAFASLSGHHKLVNATMEGLLGRLGLTSLTNHRVLRRQLCQLSTEVNTANLADDAGKNPQWTQDNDGISSLRVSEPDGRTWLLTHQTIRDERREWNQLLAVDVSNYMALSNQLSEEIASLQERQNLLASETSRLNEALSRQLVLSTRSTIHDTLSQRISFVHRFLEDGVSDDERLSRLQSLLEDLPTELSQDRVEATPEIWLDTLRDLAAAVDLKLQISGSLPPDANKARMFTEVLREAITNVLIHTTSSEMEVRLGQDASNFWMEVSNPSTVETTLTYGTGLSNLESRLEALGGSLSVFTTPRFTLRALLPR
ncbi:ATP-binding protein [Mobiluncus sp.]|uniref:ATP-binding protein n=1 Tax=Mobiluncus sp. TaxID=47293 RepID=UPI002A91BBA4|nr:ATP-binding protein [Mobiluncus sp.]MDY6077304.1 ATP-binding protein [Mobiluncus sp.]